jgi:hypothetical protein
MPVQMSTFLNERQNFCNRAASSSFGGNSSKVLASSIARTTFNLVALNFEEVVFTDGLSCAT